MNQNDLTMEILKKNFEALLVTELYDLLRLRSDIFVVEQNCVYQDMDGKDSKALHIIGKKEDKVVAYTRCFAPGVYFQEASIGRVLVGIEYRNHGYGHDIMKASIRAIKDQYNTDTIKISAQTYLRKFYETHDFKKVGEGYFEDGIPHIAMVKTSLL